MIGARFLRSTLARRAMCHATRTVQCCNRSLSVGIKTGPGASVSRAVRRTAPQALASLIHARDGFPKPAERRGSVATGARVRRGSKKASPIAEVEDAPLSEEILEPEAAIMEADVDEEVEENIDDSVLVGAEFGDLGIDELYTARLPEIGIVTPTEVQQRAIPAILTGRNTAIASYTGSGKTLSYILPAMQLAVQQAEELLQTVDPSERAKLGPTAIIVAPSRELAMQILNVARQVLPDEAKQAVQQLIGGANLRRQDEALRKYQPIMVVGTPGRLAEHSRRGTLASHKTGIMVLDEADQLLAPNFREDMLRLTQHIGKRREGGRQTVLVSATLTPGVIKSAAKWCPEPELVFTQGHIPASEDGTRESQLSKRTISPAAADDAAPAWGWGSSAGGVFTKAEGSAAAGVGNQDAVPSMPPGLQHLYVITPFRHKVDAVRRAIHATGAQRALVFMNFQQRIKDTEAKLANRRMPVAGLHGELTAMQRRNILQGFRNGKFRALIVSDVAARGLDVQDCDAVINLELPSEATHYAHRAGRTGRAGKDGVVVTIVTDKEKHVVSKLSKKLHVDIQETQVSHGKINEPWRPKTGSTPAAANKSSRS